MLCYYSTGTNVLESAVRIVYNRGPSQAQGLLWNLRVQVERVQGGLLHVPVVVRQDGHLEIKQISNQLITTDGALILTPAGSTLKWVPAMLS